MSQGSCWPSSLRGQCSHQRGLGSSESEAWGRGCPLVAARSPPPSSLQLLGPDGPHPSSLTPPRGPCAVNHFSLSRLYFLVLKEHLFF